MCVHVQAASTVLVLVVLRANCFLTPKVPESHLCLCFLLDILVLWHAVSLYIMHICLLNFVVSIAGYIVT